MDIHALNNLVDYEGVEEDEEDVDDVAKSSAKKKKELLEQLDAIPHAVSRLAGTNPPLS